MHDHLWRRLRAACLLLLAAPLLAHAANEQPVNIESDRLTVDDAKQVAVFEGRVILTRGSFILRSDKLVVRKDAEGFQHATAYGNPATFRDKRSGTDEWIDGEALRIEYDGRKDFIELFDQAWLKRGQDEVRGNYVSYDAPTDFFTVKSSRDAAPDASGDSRVRAVIQSKPKDAPPPAKPPASLRPSATLGDQP